MTFRPSKPGLCRSPLVELQPACNTLVVSKATNTKHTIINLLMIISSKISVEKNSKIQWNKEQTIK
jgi:hypothetical protein